MEPEVSATSSYCKYINDLFDILNSSYSKDRVPLRRSIYPLSPSWEKLKELKAWLTELSKMNTKRPRFIQGWIQSINVIYNLFPVLQDSNVKFFSTRNICQDPLELFFSKIRAVHKLPTAKQFSESYRVVSLSSFFKPSKLANCESVDEYNEVQNLMQQVNFVY